MLPDFKTYHKTIVIKTVWYWQKTDQCNRTDSLEIHPQTFSQLIFDDRLTTVQWREDSFSRNCSKTTGHPHTQKMDLDTDLTFFRKINLKWNVELNIKCKIVKLLGDSIGKILDVLEQGDNFLDTMSEALSVKK